MKKPIISLYAVVFMTTFLPAQSSDLFKDCKVYTEFQREELEIKTKKDEIKLLHQYSQRKIYNESVSPDFSDEVVYLPSFGTIDKISAVYGEPLKNGKFRKTNINEFLLQSDFEVNLQNSLFSLSYALFH